MDREQFFYKQTETYLNFLYYLQLVNIQSIINYTTTAFKHILHTFYTQILLQKFYMITCAAVFWFCITNIALEKTHIVQCK